MKCLEHSFQFHLTFSVFSNAPRQQPILTNVGCAHNPTWKGFSKAAICEGWRTAHLQWSVLIRLRRTIGYNPCRVVFREILNESHILIHPDYPPTLPRRGSIRKPGVSPPEADATPGKQSPLRKPSAILPELLNLVSHRLMNNAETLFRFLS